MVSNAGVLFSSSIGRSVIKSSRGESINWAPYWFEFAPCHTYGLWTENLCQLISWDGSRYYWEVNTNGKFPLLDLSTTSPNEYFASRMATSTLQCHEWVPVVHSTLDNAENVELTTSIHRGLSQWNWNTILSLGTLIDPNPTNRILFSFHINHWLPTPHIPRRCIVRVYERTKAVSIS
jgi:hypothetical protein